MIERFLDLTLRNPIIVKSARSKLRKKFLIPWAVVVLTITGFVSAIVYTVQIEQGDVDPEQAARVTLLPIIIVQAVLLMLVGTGAVGAGVAQEREDGLLDYQRLTPMRPAAKLIGYLFGLPIREYVLFVMTLPLLAFGIIKGAFPLSTVGHFYLIFFSSVVVYHMTGIVAGMLSQKPRQVAFISYVMVLLLYLALPNLSHIGFTFFEFLTIRPALFGLISQEIHRVGGTAEMIVNSRFTALDSFRDIPFFGWTIQPGMYSLLVQGGLLLTLWTVAYRKWSDDRALAFSKPFTVVFFAGASVFLIGSVWPFLTSDQALLQYMMHFYGEHTPPSMVRGTEESLVFSLIFTFVSLAILLLLGILCIFASTPNLHRMTGGWRRATRLGMRRVPLHADEASSFPVIAACSLIGAATYAIILWLALDNGRILHTPPLLTMALPAVYFIVLMHFLHAGFERFGARATFVSVFLLWMVPIFSAILLGAIFENETLSGYVALPFPPATLFFMGTRFFELGFGEIPADDAPGFVDHLGTLVILPVVLYTVLAIPLVLALLRKHREIKAMVLAEAGHTRPEGT